jgi:hypothetical protein
VSIVYRQGKEFDSRSARMVDALVDEFGEFRIVQGSYNPGGVGASAHTHDLGGAIDVSDNGMSSARRDEFVRDARKIGWAMWLRPSIADKWDSHFHGIAIQPGGKSDQGVLHPDAHDQVIDYYEGRNGLANDGQDPHAHLGVKPTTFEQYLASKEDDDMPLTQADANLIARTLANDTAFLDAVARRTWTGNGGAPAGTPSYFNQLVEAIYQKLWAMPFIERVARYTWTGNGGKTGTPSFQNQQNAAINAAADRVISELKNP